MTKFVLEIELGNDEIKTGHDIANALFNVSKHIYETQEMKLASLIEVGRLKNRNGNTIGSWKVMR